MIERKRKVDIEKLSEEQVDRISQQISNKLNKIIDKAVNEANEILSIYGLCTKMQFETLKKINSKN